jgi:ParB-like chromosome segregation protein Spo0J
MADETPITRACKAWRSVLPVHPACEVLPAYDDSKLIKLGRDIKASGGIKIPIIVLVPPDGRLALLDGRSRLDAMCHVGIKFMINVVDGHVVIDAPDYDIPAPIEIVPDANFNAFAFVLSTNLHRRHLRNEEKRDITRKVIAAQPSFTDNAIAKMAGVDSKTVKRLRLDINANSEIQISDRVEATGRKARGRKPKIHPAPVATPIDVTPTPPTVADQPPAPPVAPAVAAVPIATTSIKPKPAAPSFDAEEALAQARRVLAVLERPVSAPNRDAARKEVFHLIDLLLRHKTLKPAAERARVAA